MKSVFKFILLLCFLCFSAKGISQKFSAIDTHLASIPTQNYSNIEQLHNQIVKPRFNRGTKSIRDCKVYHKYDSIRRTGKDNHRIRLIQEKGFAKTMPNCLLHYVSFQILKTIM